MVDSFIAAAVTAEMCSPILITFLTMFRLWGGWNLGVWVLCFFASGCVNSLRGRLGQTGSLQGGRTARAATARAGFKPCCLAPRHSELLMIYLFFLNKINIFLKVFWSFLAKRV